MKIIAVIDVPDVDPTRVDPHDVVEDILAVYDDAHALRVEFVSAEWED